MSVRARLDGGDHVLFIVQVPVDARFANTIGSRADAMESALSRWGSRRLPRLRRRSGAGRPASTRPTSGSKLRGVNGASSVDPRVIVVEDDPGLRSVIVRGLAAAAFTVRGVATGAELLAELPGAPVDALVIDIGLPDTDGRDLCQAVRSRGIDAPVIFLTARGELVDRLGGFAVGGDDYLTKPFDLAELAARLSALVRRSRRPSEDAPAHGVYLDPSEHAARSGERATRLTPTEFRILAALAARPGEAVRRGELAAAGWPHGAIVHDNTLDAYIARLRRKLREIDADAGISTVRGVGYRLE